MHIISTYTLPTCGQRIILTSQVSNHCEKQMASQHKLAQSVRTNYSNIMEGVHIT